MFGLVHMQKFWFTPKGWTAIDPTGGYWPVDPDIRWSSGIQCWCFHGRFGAGCNKNLVVAVAVVKLARGHLPHINAESSCQ